MDASLRRICNSFATSRTVRDPFRELAPWRTAPRDVAAVGRALSISTEGERPPVSDQLLSETLTGARGPPSWSQELPRSEFRQRRPAQMIRSSSSIRMRKAGQRTASQPFGHPERRLRGCELRETEGCGYGKITVFQPPRRTAVRT
jgi:hypothetical protein